MVLATAPHTYGANDGYLRHVALEMRAMLDLRNRKKVFE